MNSSIYEGLASEFRKAMVDRGIRTEKELARASGVSRATVSAILNGKVVALASLSSVADALELELQISALKRAA